MGYNYWVVTIHKDGNHVELHERSFKQHVVNALVDVFFEVDEKLNHPFCGANIPESWFDINVGKRNYDAEYDILDSSLGMRLYRIQSKLVSKLMDLGEGTPVEKLPIDQEMTDKLWPEMSFLGKDEDDDDE